MNEEQQQLFNDNSGLAYAAIKRFCKKKSNGQYKRDIYGLAFLGLALAIKRYKSSQASFSTFAHHTINGTIRNGLRRLKGLKYSGNRGYYYEFRIYSDYHEVDAETNILSHTATPNDHYIDEQDTVESIFDPLGKKGKQIAIEHFLYDHTKKSLAKRFGMKLTDVYNYVNRAKELAGKYYGADPKYRNTGAKRYQCFGESLTMAELTKKYDINYSMLRQRLDRGWSVEDAVTKPRQVRA